MERASGEVLLPDGQFRHDRVSKHAHLQGETCS